MDSNRKGSFRNKVNVNDEKVSIFYSYSHKDEELRERFDIHMAGLRRRLKTDEWYDKKIYPGENYKDVIDKNLSKADIILFLVSADFIASEYCHNEEVIKAIQRHNDGLCRVVPIILRECDCEGSPFESILSLPSNMKPIVSKHWHDADEAFTHVVKELGKLIKKIAIDKKKLSDENNNEHCGEIIKTVKNRSKAKQQKVFPSKENESISVKNEVRIVTPSLQELMDKDEFINFIARNGIKGQEFDIKALSSITLKELEVELINHKYLDPEYSYIFILKRSNRVLDDDQTLSECQIVDEDVILISTDG